MNKNTSFHSAPFLFSTTRSNRKTYLSFPLVCSTERKFTSLIITRMKLNLNQYGKIRHENGPTNELRIKHVGGFVVTGRVVPCCMVLFNFEGNFSLWLLVLAEITIMKHFFRGTAYDKQFTMNFYTTWRSIDRKDATRSIYLSTLLSAMEYELSTADVCQTFGRVRCIYYKKIGCRLYVVCCSPEAWLKL